MELNDNVELIHLAIQRLIENKKKKKKNRVVIADDDDDDDDDDDHLLLSRLLSQLETLKGDGILQKHEPLSEEELELHNSRGVGEVKNKKKSETVGAATSIDADKDDIVKEIKKLKKQNLITHCLLSFMIVLTIVWQVSEVSLIMKVKDGLKNPFSMFTGMLKGPTDMIDENKESLSTKRPKIEALSTALKLPELHPMDLSSLGLDGDE